MLRRGSGEGQSVTGENTEPKNDTKPRLNAQLGVVKCILEQEGSMQAAHPQSKGRAERGHPEPPLVPPFGWPTVGTKAGGYFF